MGYTTPTKLPRVALDGNLAQIDEETPISSRASSLRKRFDNLDVQSQQQLSNQATPATPRSATHLSRVLPGPYTDHMVPSGIAGLNITNPVDQ